MSGATCQSCGMTMFDEKAFGTNSDGTKSEDYCCYCFQNGEFGKDETMEEMVESCIPFRVDDGTYPDADTARAQMLNDFKEYKRWKTN